MLVLKNRLPRPAPHSVCRLCGVHAARIKQQRPVRARADSHRRMRTAGKKHCVRRAALLQPCRFKPHRGQFRRQRIKPALIKNPHRVHPSLSKSAVVLFEFPSRHRRFVPFHFRLCAPFPHSYIGFSSSVRLRTREHCAFLRAAVPHKGERQGLRPYNPGRNLRFLHLPLWALTFASRSPPPSRSSHYFFHSPHFYPQNSLFHSPERGILYTS